MIPELRLYMPIPRHTVDILYKALHHSLIQTADEALVWASQLFFGFAAWFSLLKSPLAWFTSPAPINVIGVSFTIATGVDTRLTLVTKHDWVLVLCRVIETHKTGVLGLLHHYIDHFIVSGLHQRCWPERNRLRQLWVVKIESFFELAVKSLVQPQRRNSIWGFTVVWQGGEVASCVKLWKRSTFAIFHHSDILLLHKRAIIIIWIY